MQLKGIRFNTFMPSITIVIVRRHLQKELMFFVCPVKYFIYYTEWNIGKYFINQYNLCFNDIRKTKLKLK